jgi:subtilisin family serine protease
VGRRHAPYLAATALLICVSLVLPSVAGAHPGATQVSGGAQPERPNVAGSGTRDDALLVHLRPGKSPDELAAALAAAGGVAVGRLDEVGTVVVEPAAGRARDDIRARLAMSSAVQSVEQDEVGHVTLDPNDTLWYEQWASRKVHAPNAWNTTTGDGGPVIAILDSGVYAGHVDLARHVLAGWDFVNDDSNPADDMGHGTMVAGTAGGKGNNDIGIAGACWGCRILPVKVVNSSGNVTWSNAAAGIIWATKQGAKVISMSFGKTTGNSTLQSAVAYARNHGVIVIASAGNNGNTAKFYPAAYSGVISVAATTSSDTLYSWSTRGSWVRLAAPGCVWTTKRSGGWGSFCGTSASAPLVAGIAGLAYAAKPGATRDEVEQAILKTAIHFTWRISGGRVDASAAVSKLSPTPPPTPSPPPTSSPTPPAPTPTTSPGSTPTPTIAPTPTATP